MHGTDVQVWYHFNAMHFLCWFCMIYKGTIFFTVLEHKNTIIHLQIFRKHGKFTYLFLWKTLLEPVILLWNACSVSECLVFFYLCDSAHCQFAQLNFDILGCQLVENTAHCSQGNQQMTWVKPGSDNRNCESASGLSAWVRTLIGCSV